MAKILLLKNYNNYFNRIIKGYSDLSDYQTAVGTGNYDLDIQINFNPNDNVSAELIINDCPFDADYLIVADDTTSDIISRWFILESKRTRKGQYALSLRRDVIFDYQQELINSPVYIQKAVLPEDDPFILNSEGMSFNEIKTSETLLKDKTGCSWIVLYLAKNATPSEITVNSQAEDIQSIALSTIASDAGMTEGQLATILNFTPQTTPSFFTSDIEIRYGVMFARVAQTYKALQRVRNYFKGNYDKNGYEINNVFAWTKPLFTYYDTNVGVDAGKIAKDIEDKIYAARSSILSDMSTIMNRSYFQISQLEAIKNYATSKTGKYVLYNGNYYDLEIEESGVQQDKVGPAIYTSFTGISTAIANSAYASLLNADGEISLWTRSTKCWINMNQISVSSGQLAAATVKIPSTRNVLEDQPFDIIAIPNGRHLYNGTALKGSLAKRVAQAIALQLDANVYDIQLLPYCPFTEIINPTTGSLDMDYATKKGYWFETIDLPDSLVDGLIIFPKKASFTAKLNYSLTMSEGAKIEVCCNKYRLTSPNYQGSFEFNLAKNGGSVDYFIADCTYKPYTPYIRVVPNFNYLYGTDYGDNRGLLCSGDFSFGRINSAWESFALNNKNYQNIFNRDIQNLDFEQSIQMRNQIVSSAVGVATAGAAGAGAGAFSGGGWVGALLGATAGGLASAAGAYIDTDTLSRQQREAKSLAIDKYNYQLGNIKALPYTLTKVSAFDINSKIWPFLEYYTCTDAEKEALNEKIAFESMTVMRIGIFGTYFNAFDTPRYFKGELIRCEELAENTHVLEAIYSELLKGVYM